MAFRERLKWEERRGTAFQHPELSVINMLNISGQHCLLTAIKLLVGTPVVSSLPVWASSHSLKTCMLLYLVILIGHVCEIK